MRTFRVQQGFNGAIYLSLNNSSVILMEDQICGLQLDLSEVPQFNFALYMNFYK